MNYVRISSPWEPDSLSSLKFGTSGLRGLVSELPDDVCFAYAAAFLQWMQKAHGLEKAQLVLVGYDLRDSSVRIADACMAAVRAMGMSVENCGALPTPALALRAQTVGAPAIMVTGSHIPADRNGLKFYRADGEIDKADEAGILALVDLVNPQSVKTVKQDVSGNALAAYEQRCLSMLHSGALKGMRIGVYQHSSVARDFMASVLTKLGADAVPLGRSDVFVPVDTEALREEDVAFAANAVAEYKLDALVSTDGDADRPLLADEKGRFIRGDLLGILTSKFLDADCVVTPVTSTSLVDSCGYFSKVMRTKVGSPFVIEAIEAAKASGANIVIGFEANGGVLLGSDVLTGSGLLPALITRDAMLPILGVIGLAVRGGKVLSQITNELPARFNQSGRLEHIDQSITNALLKQLQDASFRDKYFAEIGFVSGQDAIDGARFVFANGDVIHYRASGNAPELRCYSETGSGETSVQLLQWGLAAAARAIV
jgi:phosphomannomutase